jgi:hypothetical protein
MVTMEKISVSVDVPKETYEFAQGVVKFLVATKTAFNELVPAMSGVMDLPAEYKDDPAAFIQAFMLAGGEAFKLFRTE